MRHEHTESEDNAALMLGRAVHTVVLEPDVFPLEFAVIPNDRETGKTIRRGTKAWNDFAAGNAGKTLIKQEEYEQHLAIRERTG